MRADYWLQSETKNKVLKKIEGEIISKKAELIASKDSGCHSMFQRKALDELALMFRVFRRDEETFKLIIKHMCPYIEKRGTELIQDENLSKNPIEFTKKLLELKAEMDQMIEYSFQQQLPFQLGRDNSFQTFINNSEYSALYIATFSDHEMRSGFKGVTEEDINKRLDAIIDLFRCLNSRDMFMGQYLQHFSQRLLDKSFQSKEAEEQMLSKLQIEHGYKEVSRMLQMFKDILVLSKETKDDFAVSATGRTVQNQFDFNIEILSSSIWPNLGGSNPCSIPPQMAQAVSSFEIYYKNKHAKRKLEWIQSHGNVELITLYTKGRKYQLVTTVPQTAILMLFSSQ